MSGTYVKRIVSFLQLAILGCVATACLRVESARDLSASVEPCVSELPTSVSVEVVYPGFSNWMDWVDGPVTTNPCDENTSDYCYHGGEARKVEVTDLDSCTGLSAIDSLDAFHWRCDDSSGTATFLNAGLRDETKLEDLIDDVAMDWRDLSVTVSDSCDSSVTTSSSKWWTNPIVTPPDNSATALIVLDGTDDDAGGPDEVYAEGTIFLVKTTTGTTGYNLQRNKLGFVILEGAYLHYTGTVETCTWWGGSPGANRHCLLASDWTNSFIWVEGEFHGNEGVQQAINGYYHGNPKFVTVRHANVQGFSGLGLYFTGGRESRMIMSRSSRNNTDGMGLSGTTGGGHIVYKCSGSNNGDSGIFLNQGDNVGLLLTATHNRYGLEMNTDDVDNSVLQYSTAAGNGNRGIYLWQADMADISHMVLVNNGSGLLFANSADGHSISDILLADNGTEIWMSGSSTGHTFSGKIWMDSAGTQCNIAAGVAQGIDSSCNPLAPSTFTWDNDVSVADSFVGVASSDSSNDHSALISAGAGFVAFASITDWFGFDSIYRSWGDGDAVSVIDSTNRDECNDLDCGLWDWRLRTGDTGNSGSAAMMNVNACPNGGVTSAHTWSDASTTTYLEHAIELPFDGQGNENGLCESNEHCLYMPNLGSYQGHGDRVAASSTANACADIGSGGTVENVTLWQYQINGF